MLDEMTPARFPNFIKWTKVIFLLLNYLLIDIMNDLVYIEMDQGIH